MVMLQKLQKIENFLFSIHYPSITARIPRSISKMHLYKGNEFRFILLFGFIPFENYISVDHCSNLLCLVMAMHLAEMSSIDKSQCNEINEL